DLDAARELDASFGQRLAGQGTLPNDVAAALADDVRGFGELLCLVATGHIDGRPESPNHAFDDLVARCSGQDHYTSLADNRLWRDLAIAERAQTERSKLASLGALATRLRRRG